MKSYNSGEIKGTWLKKWKKWRSNLRWRSRNRRYNIQRYFKTSKLFCRPLWHGLVHAVRSTSRRASAIYNLLPVHMDCPAFWTTIAIHLSPLFRATYPSLHHMFSRSHVEYLFNHRSKRQENAYDYGLKSHKVKNFILWLESPWKNSNQIFKRCVCLGCNFAWNPSVCNIRLIQDNHCYDCDNCSTSLYFCDCFIRNFTYVFSF